jgi:prephenate dehydratase
MPMKTKPIFGIQGGQGSFNEQALLDYVSRHNIGGYEIQYLYNTQNVFSHLEDGSINVGQFALHNAIGGLVSESLEAISKHTFTIVEEFGIVIAHSLMTLPDTNFSDVKTFMSHPQVFKQCKNTLATKYQWADQKSGTGDLIDHAKVAEELSKGTIDKNIAVLGPKILAEIYSLKIVEEDLQDKKDNITTFLMVSR